MMYMIGTKEKLLQSDEDQQDRNDEDRCGYMQRWRDPRTSFIVKTVDQD